VRMASLFWAVQRFVQRFSVIDCGHGTKFVWFRHNLPAGRVTPALGGLDDIRNLWPHSYASLWNARVKDALEDRLRAMVCDGRLDLADARREIATNWIGAYKKYFHTDHPLPEPSRQ